MLSGKKRPPIKLSLFTNFSESFSSDYGSKSPTLSKSPRNFEGGVVGLGIVAAMNDTHEAFRSAKSSRAAKMAVSPKSEPIPIVSAKPIVKFREPIVEKEEIELSESYTCVISHLGNGKSVRKREYFDEPEDINWGNSGVFFTSTTPPPPPPPKNTQGGGGGALVFQGGDFLSSCYLCRKKLHGLDIFMYRGDRAFCSAECRSKHISSDEFKEKCASGALKKAFDYSVTPYSAPRFLSSGVAAA